MKLTIIGKWVLVTDWLFTGANGNITTPGTPYKIRINANWDASTSLYNFCLFFFDSTGKRVYPTYTKIGGYKPFTLTEHQTLNFSFGGKCNSKIFDFSGFANLWLDSKIAIDISKTRVYSQREREIHSSQGFLIDTEKPQFGSTPDVPETNVHATRGTRGRRGSDDQPHSTSIHLSDTNYLSFIDDYHKLMLNRNIGTVIVNKFTTSNEFVYSVNLQNNINWVTIFSDKETYSKYNYLGPEKKFIWGNIYICLFKKPFQNKGTTVNETMTVSQTTTIFKIEIG